MKTTITAELLTDTEPTDLDLVYLARAVLDTAAGRVGEVKVWRGAADSSPAVVVTTPGGSR